MKLLIKSSTLILCLTIVACSSPGKPERPAAQAAKSGASAPTAKFEFGASQAPTARHEAEVREAVKGSRFEVERRGDLLVVTAPVDSSFNPDRPSMMLASTLGPLSRVAKLVAPDREVAVLLLGHGDDSESPALALKLSQERAQSMASIFRLSGLHQDRLMYKGMGDGAPRASNDSEDGRSHNRRVEMFLAARGSLPAVLAQYGVPGVGVVASGQAK
ncbi:OmpA family protein [Azotobacter beijerinckii]|uniref:Outer membrane protein OmpA n=1 Tax=Azotobacter beijerinckii TaxID=170623 RepID=A0A1I4CKB0_9GAMM|nr:OmpA family protein [Azotobacter beijerinckii]SFB37565.1 Outer membrane protein OmpA [Azotobacter beijerinckii]SFK81060.1 Outer membrane protein OmpA [Azotobacter beijerinckii]